jgi:hypothetical protein
MSMRVIIEAREFGGVHRVEQDTDSNNWLDETRNNAARREGIIDAANSLLRALNLDEIVGEITVVK